MAHAQRLTEQVKTMSARIKQLEAALADAQIGPLPLAALGDEPTVSRRSSQDGEPIDVKHEGDMDTMSKGLGSLAIDGEGKAQYYGETAGAEVRLCSLSHTLRATDVLSFANYSICNISCQRFVARCLVSLDSS